MGWRLKTILLLILSSLAWTQTNNEEFRSTWVISWEHINGSSSVAQNQERVRQILDNHVDANMNAVLWQVRQSGTAYYNSSYEPWGYYAGSSNPGYDPLAYAIEEAHARGLELHAWFNTFQAASTSPGTPAAEHPEWVCRDQGNSPMPSYRALSPGLPEVREYLVNVAMEIVTNYDIDGLHLDYVRWNEYSDLILNRATPDPVYEISTLDQIPDDDRIQSMLDPQSGRYLYDVEHPYSGGTPDGYSSWAEFWRSSVTTFVETLHDSIQSQKPWVRLSVAALGKYNWSGWNGYDVVYQDAALWFNQGYIDHLTPMHYHWTTSSGFYDMLIGGGTYSWGNYIQPGINAGRLYSVGPGSYILDQNNVWSRHPAIVNASRSVSWVDGFQFFSYGSWQDYQYWPIAGNTFFNERTKIRDTGLIVSDTPASPTISLSTVNPLTYDITVIPDASISEDQWWAVYRSEVDEIDVDQSKIIGMYFGSTPISITEAFDGTQDHNGRYYYAATMLDRYWNESLPSARVQTAVLESYAPIVVSAYPASGDTVDVNTVLSFSFSKTMEPNTIDGAFTILPPVDIEAFSWSESDHRLTVYLQESLEFLATYSVTLSAVLTDINGVGLDGDADGTSGGNFIFTFHTKEVDESGPTILYSNPDLLSGAEEFDTEASLSFVFDEELDPATVTTNAISFVSGGVELDYDYLLTGFYGKSILDIKLYEPLEAATDYSLTLASSITDTLGNSMDNDISVGFTTINEHYSELVPIDYFTYTGEWWDPEGSGSTVGTIGSATSFGYSSSVYLPGSSIYAQGKKSAFIRYEWDLSSGSHLLREYLSGGAPRDVHFDNSYTIQCYVYGDASNNKFRFAIDEAVGDSWPNHEVSVWYTIDWEGWRLLEWDLSDPEMVGTWIGNGALDGTAYRVDSFQMTYDNENGEASGRIFLDNFRVIKRMPGVSIDEGSQPHVPTDVTLFQNYPNPFNPETLISFELPMTMHAKLRIFNIAGQEVALLIDEELSAGIHQIRYNGSSQATGIYLVRLETLLGNQVKRILLLK